VEEERQGATEAIETTTPAAPAAAAPAEAERVVIPRAGASGDVMGALRSMASVDWQTIDIELPPLGYIGTVGGTVQTAGAAVACDCGEAVLAIELDGESRSRCPKCQAVFRHVLLIQREDQAPSAAAYLVDELLRVNGLKA